MLAVHLFNNKVQGYALFILIYRSKNNRNNRFTVFYTEINDIIIEIKITL